MTKLSIVTINLNNRNGLESTLDSIFRQEFNELEVIVVDGGSVDGSVDVIKKYHDKIFKFFVGKDTGIYNAMNIGIECATGKYVHILNSGDTYYDRQSLSRVDFDCGKEFLCFAVKKYSPKKYIWFPKVVNMECFVDLAHPGLIVRNDIYINNFYNETFRVVSDSLFIYENVKPSMCFLSDEILVEMQPEGISTQVSLNYELEKQVLYWKYGYRSKRRLLLSLKSFVIFLKRCVLKYFKR